MRCANAPNICMDNRLHIQVACAWPERALVRELSVAPGTSAAEAVEQSGVLAELANTDLGGISPTSFKLGIFGKIIKPAHVLEDGDRVEIYRPLLLDPKQARRERAQRSTRR